METKDITNTSNIDTTAIANVMKYNNCDVPFNSIDYLTLEIMANTDSYNKYLKKNNLDHDSVLKKEKRFYRKRIISMAKDILFNNNSGQDEEILNAFNTYARACISYFKFKDTMDTIQGEYNDINHETYLNSCGVDNDTADNDYEECNYNPANNLSEANKLCMKQTDKKIITLDNYVIKTTAPKNEMILPKTKNINLKDPKFKKKDIKVSMLTSVPISTPTSIPTPTN